MRNPSQVFETGDRALNITATNATLIGGGSLLGIFVASASATPTIKVADTTGTLVNTFTPTAGQFYRLPTKWNGTLTVTISGTVDCTVFYKQ
jgi:hypothetical protein